MTTSERIQELGQIMTGTDRVSRELLIDILDQMERRIQNMESAHQTTNIRIDRLEDKVSTDK